MPRKALWSPVVSEFTGLVDFIILVNRRLKNVFVDDGNALCEIHLDGGGAVLTTGVKLDVAFPDFSCVITGWMLVGDQSGSMVVDLWTDAYGNFPPTVLDTITASAKPTITAATKNRATSVPTWNRTITQGDVLRVNIDSCSSIRRATLALSLLKT